MKPLFFAAVAVAAGLTAGLAFERVDDIQIRKRPADPLASARAHCGRSSS